MQLRQVSLRSNPKEQIDNAATLKLMPQKPEKPAGFSSTFSSSISHGLPNSHPTPGLATSGATISDEESDNSEQEKLHPNLEAMAEDALLEPGFRPISGVGEDLKLRDLGPFDVVTPPDREKVIAYGRMFNGTLIMLGVRRIWDFEMLLELHRRGKWRIVEDGQNADAEVVGRTDPENANLLRKYDKKWKIVTRKGRTWMKGESEEEEKEEASENRSKRSRKRRRRGKRKAKT